MALLSRAVRKRATWQASLLRSSGSHIRANSHEQFGLKKHKFDFWCGRCDHEFVIEAAPVTAKKIAPLWRKAIHYRMAEDVKAHPAGEVLALGLAMFSTLNCRLLQRSFLMRLLQTTGLSLALMTASAVGIMQRP